MPGAFQEYPEGVPELLPTAFREDNAGNLWFGFYVGGIVRYCNKKFDRFGREAGAYESIISYILRDHRGRSCDCAHKSCI